MTSLGIKRKKKIAKEGKSKEFFSFFKEKTKRWGGVRFNELEGEKNEKRKNYPKVRRSWLQKIAAANFRKIMQVFCSRGMKCMLSNTVIIKGGTCLYH